MSPQPNTSNLIAAQPLESCTQAVLTFCLEIPAGVTPVDAMASTILAALGPQADRLVRWAIIQAPINASHWKVAGAYLTK
jgi:hypothetical protein